MKHESQSSLIQSFWFGKALQRAYNEGKALANVNSVNENGEFVNPTEHKETSLSRNVHKLICESFNSGMMLSSHAQNAVSPVLRLRIWRYG